MDGFLLAKQFRFDHFEVQARGLLEEVAEVLGMRTTSSFVG